MSAAQTRWITTAREGLTAAVRRTAASRHPVLAAPAAARMSPVVKQFSPSSVSLHTQLPLTEWGCSLSERDGNLSSPSSVSFPNPFAPHFLYIPSLVIILILAIIWILFSNLPTIYWITLEIQEKIHYSPLMKKVMNFSFFWDHLLMIFISFENQMALWALLCNINFLLRVTSRFLWIT